MQSCDLQIGAFYRSSDSTFADVELASEPLGSFTTGLNATFPTGILNTTQPTGYPAGAGGSTGVNRVIPCNIANLPDEPFSGAPSPIEDSGIVGDPLWIRLKGIPRQFSCSLALPDIEISGTDYNRTWDDLKRISIRRPWIWVLHDNFLIKCFIKDSGTIMGRPSLGFERITFGIKYLYLPTISGTTKTYTYMSIV